MSPVSSTSSDEMPFSVDESRFNGWIIEVFLLYILYKSFSIAYDCFRTKADVRGTHRPLEESTQVHGSPVFVPNPYKACGPFRA